MPDRRGLDRLPPRLAARAALLIDLLDGHWARWAALLAVSALAPAFLAARIWLLKVLVDSVLLHHRVDLALPVAAGIAGTGVARAAANLVVGRLSGTISADLTQQLRSRMYRSMLGTSLTWLRTQRLGDLLTRLSSDVGAISDVVCSSAAAAVGQASTAVLFLALLAVISPSLLLLGLSVLPVVVVLTVFEARASRRAQVALRESSAVLTDRAQERLSAVSTVKALSAGVFELGEYADRAASAAGAQLAAVRVRTIYPAAAELLAALAAGAVVWEGVRQAAAGTITTGDLVAFVTYLLAVFAPIRGLGASSGAVARAGVGLDRVAEVLAAARTHPDPVRPMPAPAAEGTSRTAAGAARTGPAPGGRQGVPSLVAPRRDGIPALELDDVWFGYEPGRPVLRGVSMHVAPGEIVALVGPSGAGKTTLVALALGFYRPQAGTVRVAGHDLAALGPAQLSRLVSAVLQEPMVFDGTIEENVAYDRPATDRAVEAALREADLHRVAARRLGEPIGARGSALSGGERHRLALARAVVREPALIVLDEPTASLDEVTERRVTQALRAHRGRRAVLLVTHGAIAQSVADRVYEMSAGRLRQRETGTTGRRGPLTLRTP